MTASKLVHPIYSEGKSPAHSCTSRLEILLEPRKPIPLDIPHHIPARQQQVRKSRGPEAQVPIGQSPDGPAQRLGHILVVVPLVAQGAEEIQHARARVLALLAEAVDELAGELAEEVGLDDAGGRVLEGGEGGRGRVALLLFKVVRHVAEEGEALLGVPEEGVGHDFLGRGPRPGVGVEHGADEVLGFVGEVAERVEIVEVVLALADVDFAHVAVAAVEGVVSLGEDVEEDEAEREDVDGACDAALVGTDGLAQESRA